MAFILLLNSCGDDGPIAIPDNRVPAVYVTIVDEAGKPIPSAELNFPAIETFRIGGGNTIQGGEVTNAYVYPNPTRDFAELVFGLNVGAQYRVELFRWEEDSVLTTITNQSSPAGEYRFSANFLSRVDSARARRPWLFADGQASSLGAYKMIVTVDTTRVIAPFFLLDKRTPCYTADTSGKRTLFFEKLPFKFDCGPSADSVGKKGEVYGFDTPTYTISCTAPGYSVETKIVKGSGIQDVKFVLKKK